jgi:hypothetical protein
VILFFAFRIMVGIDLLMIGGVKHLAAGWEPAPVPAALAGGRLARTAITAGFTISTALARLLACSRRQPDPTEVLPRRCGEEGAVLLCCSSGGRTPSAYWAILGANLSYEADHDRRAVRSGRRDGCDRAYRGRAHASVPGSTYHN